MATRVLLTGASGFIAKHIALQLLEAGYEVRGTVRSRDKAVAVEDALKRAGAAMERLECVEADLTADAGWDDATEGCRYLVHTASPFPVRQSKDKFALVPVARGGTMRVLEAAKRAGVERTVLTSSVVAVYYGHENRRDPFFTETDWSNVESSSISAYAVSKTEAEKAAWAFVEDASMELVAINPAFVQGPLLDNDAGTSAKIIEMMMKGKIPAVPNISFGVVDVRDVARAHVAALTTPEAAGRRFLLSAGSRNLSEIAAAVAAAEPSVKRRMPKFTFPDAVMRFIALFSSAAKGALPELGREKTIDTGPARDILGLEFRTPEAAVGAMASSLRRVGLVS